jgi:glycosyltransferase involved in cell wall biosynthesis
MISVLIPVYNFDVNKLAAELSRQMDAPGNPGEIILLDDGSSPPYRSLNAATASLPHVQYLEAGTNYGRIRIRQLLAEKARFEYLLFLDCDSEILSEEFLAHYKRHINRTKKTVVGGRVYQQQMPDDCSLRLHWLYGSKREAIKTEIPVKLAHRGFMSNNFMIHKSIFDQLHFVDDWQGYGHEDTWIGIQLEKLGACMSYINNPALHLGLEKTEVFIPKSEQALQNLLKLQVLVPKNALKKHVKLYSVYTQLKSFGLLWLPQLLYKMIRKRIFKNLQSCHPSLFYFDLYRLYQFIQLSSPHK